MKADEWFAMNADRVTPIELAPGLWVVVDKSGAPIAREAHTRRAALANARDAERAVGR